MHIHFKKMRHPLELQLTSVFNVVAPIITVIKSFQKQNHRGGENVDSFKRMLKKVWEELRDINYVMKRQ